MNCNSIFKQLMKSTGLNNQKLQGTKKIHSLLTSIPISQ